MPRRKAVTKPAAKRGSDAEQRFIQDALARGQAVFKTPELKELPPGATHWIIKDDKTGELRLQRGRFSMA